MPYTIIQRLIHACRELAAAVESKPGDRKDKQISRWLGRIEKENAEELSMAREFNISFLLKLHGFMRTRLQVLKNNFGNKDVCLAAIKEIISRLESVTNQAEVRDQVIREVIHPVMKAWGWKKKGRSFIKEESGYTKKLRLFSSQWNDYYRIEFRFEMDVQGKGVDVYGETIDYETPLGSRARAYELTEDADIGKIKAQIQADLKQAKRFFNRYR